MNYHIARNGQQIAGLTELDIRNRLTNGQLSPQDLCWAEGMAEWKPIGAVFPASAAPAGYGQPLNPYAPPLTQMARPGYSSMAPLASLGQRFGAAMVDLFVGFLAFLPIMFSAQMMDNDYSQRTGDAPPIHPIFWLGMLLLVGLSVYNLVLLTTKGQTIGKKVLGIRISNYLDDGNPGFVKAVLLRVFVNGLLGFIPFYGIVDLCFIFGDERRCIHDLIAGTRVVQC